MFPRPFEVPWATRPPSYYLYKASSSDQSGSPFSGGGEISFTSLAIVFSVFAAAAAIFVGVLFCLNKQLCERRRTPEEELHYPEAEPAPVPRGIDGSRSVEGAVLLSDDNRDVLDSTSVFLTLLHSCSSASSASSSSPPGSFAAATREDLVDAAAGIAGEADEARTAQGEGDANAHPRRCGPHCLHLPEEIQDVSTNSMRRLYVRRSSECVYGSSSYIMGSRTEPVAYLSEKSEGEKEEIKVGEPNSPGGVFWGDAPTRIFEEGAGAPAAESAGHGAAGGTENGMRPNVTEGTVVAFNPRGPATGARNEPFR
ncbi:uncharacterized protein Tco025E_05456 [Trypanosoma conorhini]|uniref:Uncharacterized protein n=1 Tax=Trypanosoma conorhini TaxID=83891 RepID=A0A422PD57_9TRYP|nr:uncharacterized protein Tco025E_05456 [Trypanosoma conorhini]RNF15651.1 hypothetical protein Tco025E_05456 [Trypanosoma conorhini]